MFVSVPFEELDTGGAGVAVVVAPAALVKDVCAAAVADDAYFGVLNVPEHQSHRKKGVSSDHTRHCLDTSNKHTTNTWLG